MNNYEDIIDSRDIITRIEELNAERDTWHETMQYKKAETFLKTWAESHPEDFAELCALQNLEGGAEGYSEDWQYGAALIRDSYFTEYAMELLADRGELPREIPHYIVIDEEATARNIQMDYTPVDFDGITYWIR